MKINEKISLLKKTIQEIKNISQKGPYHLGKESWEKCNFCSIEKKNKPIQKINERTMH